MTWDNRYRQLREGEEIEAGDECLTDSHLGWQPATHDIGGKAPDPAYSAHRMYRRLRDPQVFGGYAAIAGDAVVIRFPFAFMQTALDGAWGLNVFEKRQKVTDEAVFAKEFCSALNAESENGTTLIHRMADKAFVNMMEHAALGMADHEIASPTAAPREICPSCSRDDDEYLNRLFSCSNPWHSDDHLRRKTSAAPSVTLTGNHETNQGDA